MVKNHRGGYTLTEVMLVVAIIGIVGSTGALLTTKMLQAQAMADALSTIQSGAFTSFDVLSKMLRQAQADSIVIDRYDTNQPPWSRITFTMPSSSTSHSFYQKGQTLYIDNLPRLKSLRTLTFTYPNTTTSSVISISMTFEQSTGLGRSKAVQLFIQNVRIQN